MMIQWSVLAIVLIANVSSIHMVGNFVDVLLLISWIPLLLGFFWEIPEIHPDQWTIQCSNWNISLFVGMLVFNCAG